jgi:hypothetical protein
MDGCSRYLIPFETLMPKGITKYMSDRGYSLKFYSSWIIHYFSLVQVYEKSSIMIFKSTCTCLCICISDKLDSCSSPIVDLK